LFAAAWTLAIMPLAEDHSGLDGDPGLSCLIEAAARPMSHSPKEQHESIELHFAII